MLAWPVAPPATCRSKCPPVGRCPLQGATSLAAPAARQFVNEWTHDAEEIAETLAAEIRHNMLTYSVWAGNYALIIPKQLRDLFVAAGWHKHDIREYVYRSARVLRRDWATVGK